jgi:hypothetical protein
MGQTESKDLRFGISANAMSFRDNTQALDPGS